MPDSLANPLIRDTATPPIPEAVGWIGGYAGAFGPAINLVQAAPGNPPPPALLSAITEAAGDAGTARYGDIFGDSALREAFARQTSAFYGAPITPRQVAITAGCNMAFMVAVMAVAQAGDEVIVPAPWYFNHQMTLQMLGLGCTPLMCRPEAGYVPDPQDAARLISSRTRAILLVSPNNPTGATYPAATLDAFARLCRERGIWLILDETYRDFLPEELDRPHDLFADPDWGDTIIGLTSFSKAYAIPGWRLGAMLFGERLRPEIGKLLDCIQICPARAGQVGLAATLETLGDWRREMRAVINRRGAAFRRAMAGLNGWTVEQTGAYFAYVRHPFADRPAAEVARQLAEQRGVMTLPAPVFGPGQEERLRIAIANAEEDVIATLPDRFRDLP